MEVTPHLDENLLVDFTDGLLSDRDRADVERHLDGCPTCRMLVAELVKSDSMISSPGLEETAGVPQKGEPVVLHKGSTLGRYVILERLGAGGMGVVYAAYDPQLDRKISLKLLRTDVVQGSSGGEARARLLREAQAMARLSHPNVIAVHDLGTIGEQVFFAMEYVDGGTLDHWRKEKPRSRDETLEMFVKAGRGLAAAHAAGLVHRDFKPDNVLVGKDGRVRVTDFGLARPAASTMTPQIPLSREDLAKIRAGTFAQDAPLTQAGSLLGTPAYMAPEQLQGRPSDARTDQFSFCVALYEALYGERPLKGSTVAALTMSAELGLISPAPPDSKVPERLRRVLLRGLSSSPSARFPTMDALLTELSRLPAVARRGLFAGTALAVLLVAGASLTWVFSRGEEPVLCNSAERRLAGIWDEARKKELHDALAGSAAPYAKESWASVERLLDARAGAWVALRNKACEESRASGPDDQVAHRMSCLGLRRTELAAMTRLLAEPGGANLQNAVDAAAALEDPGTCAAEAPRTRPP
ncbi:MAG: protein kinase domain-containing protein, partial [Myxococcaceae bacterium]